MIAFAVTLIVSFIVLFRVFLAPPVTRRRRPLGEPVPSAPEGAQHAHVPAALPTAASAASQHGPSMTARDRRGRTKCPSSPARRASSSWSPAIRWAISARRSAMRRGNSAVVSAQWPEWRQPGDQGRVLEWDIEASQVDQKAQVLDVGLAVLAIGVVASRGPREPARALVEADGVGRDTDLRGKFAGPRRRSKPWSDSHVNRPLRSP